MSKSFLIESFFSHNNESDNVQLLMMRNNLPFIISIVKTDWTFDLGQQLYKYFLVSVYHQKNQLLQELLNTVLLPQIITEYQRLFIDQKIEYDQQLLTHKILFKSLFDNNIQRIITTASIYEVDQEFKDQLVVELSNIEQGQLKLILKLVLEYPLPNNIFVIQFYQFLIDFIVQNSNYDILVVNAILKYGPQNLGLILDTNYKNIIKLLSQYYNPKDISLSWSQRVTFVQMVNQEFIDKKKYFSKLFRFVQMKYNIFNISNQINQINQLYQLESLRSLQFLVDYQTALETKDIGHLNLVVIFGPDKILLTHCLLFMKSIIFRLQQFIHGLSQQVTRKLLQSDILLLQTRIPLSLIFELQEFIYGPQYLKQQLIQLVNEISLNIKNK